MRRVQPSRRFPSFWTRPAGSFRAGMPAAPKARLIQSFKVWYLTTPLGVCLQTKLCVTVASTKLLQSYNNNTTIAQHSTRISLVRHTNSIKRPLLDLTNKIKQSKPPKIYITTTICLFMIFRRILKTEVSISDSAGSTRYSYLKSIWYRYLSLYEMSRLSILSINIK